MRTKSILKNLLSVAMVGVLLLVPTASVEAKVQSSKAVKVAQSLYIPIGCRVDGVDRIIGTGFPVAKHLVLSAGHVGKACMEEGGVQEISTNDGVTFTPVADDKTYLSNNFDLEIMIVPDLIFRAASFRAPELGETSTGFGSAYGENGILSRGVVVRLFVEDQYIGGPTYLATNSPIGGFSGSALVGDDGKVIGIVNYGRPDYRVGGSLSGGYTGDFLKDQVDGFVKELPSGVYQQ